MDPNYDIFGYEYPSHHNVKPACLRFRPRGYGLHPCGPISPYDRRPSSYFVRGEFQPPTDYSHSPTDYEFTSTAGQFPQTDYRFPPSDYQFPPSDYQLSPTDYQFPPSDYQLSPTDYRHPLSPLIKRSANWNYCSQVPANHQRMNRQRMFRFRNGPNSIDETPLPVPPRGRPWLFDRTRSVSRAQYKRGVKRLKNASRRAFNTKIEKLPPPREIENCPPYPRNELQAARDVLINELYCEPAGVRLFRVRTAVGVFKHDPVEEAEGTCSVTYDQQAASLLTIPLPVPRKGVHVGLPDIVNHVEVCSC